MSENIDFTDYDSITDTLMFLNNEYTLQFVLQLSYKDKSGNRRFFHREATYGSRYPGVMLAHNIKREMKYFFKIQNIKDFIGYNLLFPNDVIMLLYVLEGEVLPWFFGKKSIFKIVKEKDKPDKLTRGEYKPAIYIQSERAYLRFDPIVYTDMNQMQSQGVRICLNSDAEFIDLSLDKFMQFYYILKNTDMYGTASSMASYVKTPPYGKNNWQQAGLGSGANMNDELPFMNNSNKSQNSNFLDNANKKKG